MFDEDRETGIAVAVAVAIALLVVLRVIGLTTGTALAPSSVASKSAGKSSAADARIVRLYFDVGSTELPLDALTRLAPLVTASETALLIVAGYHDASGDPAANADLARRRAVAVGELLVQAGVKPERIELRKPAMTTGGTDAREARRVDITPR